jgi:predicted alpha/beta hydrolase family esterase
MPPASPRFVIVHGWENRRPADHWEHWLFDELVARGHEVDYPQLPDPDAPDVDEWLDLLDDLVTRGERPVTLVVHSLATSLWLTRLARGGSTGLVTRLALVAIPAPSVLAPTVVASFIDHPPHLDALPGVEMHVFEGEDDEYSPSWRAGLLRDRLRGAGRARGGRRPPRAGVGVRPVAADPRLGA